MLLRHVTSLLSRIMTPCVGGVDYLRGKGLRRRCYHRRMRWVMPVLLCVLAMHALVRAQDAPWPQWRGPSGSGVSLDTGAPLEWSPDRNVAWKTEIPGRGHSSPVVAGNRVFLTTSIRGAHVPGRKAPVHLGYDRKPGYVHPDSVDVDYRHTLKVIAIDARTGVVAW